MKKKLQFQGGNKGFGLRGLPIFFCFVFVFFTGGLLAQQKTITGTVTSSDGEPLPGVNVLVKGTSNGAVADTKGKYTIKATSNDTLVFSFIGFQKKEVPVGNNILMNISLTESQTSLNEVVVVGYGTQRKKDITGSVAVVDVGEMQKVSTNDLSQQLQGRVAGVLVTSDGQPGAIPSVRLRGITTFGDFTPLYVIDGIPLQGIPRDFNPNDVESVQVLKDASAAAIYGSRAANGVIIITTKQGHKEQPLTVKYSGYYGVDKIWQHIPVAGTDEYRELDAEVRANGGTTPVVVPGNDPNSEYYIQGVNTDWQKEGLKTGMRQDQNFQFSGGGENTTYLMALDYFQNKGTFVGNGPDYKRYSARINTTAEKGRFKVGTNLFYTHSHENSLTFRDDILLGGVPPLINALDMAIPTQSVYDPNNLGGFGGTEEEIHDAISLNAIGVNSMFVNYVDVDKIYATGYGELNLINSGGNNLTYRVNVGWENTHTRDHSFVPAFDLGYFYYSNTAKLDEVHRIYNNGVLENVFDYKKVFGKHNLDVTLGYTYQKNDYLNIAAGANGFTTPYYPTLSNGAESEVSQYESYDYWSSYLGRINYNYDDRYLITLTARRDGSSRFGPENRFGYFPAASVAWRLTNEKFFNLNKNVFTDVKLRVSYGILGNANIGSYLYLTTVNRNVIYNFNNEKVIGGAQTNLVDEGIKWEELSTGNVAVDMVLFRGKVDATIEYYNKTTADLLVGVPIPLSTGSINTNVTTNAGTINNQGVEFQLGYHDHVGGFTYDISANFSYVTNRVLSLGGNNEPIYGAGSKTEVGQPIAQQYGYVYEGIFQNQDEVSNHAFQNANTAPGDIKFKDLDGNDTINEKDRTYLGNSIPKYIYGFNFTAGYKGFDFTLFASGAGGYVINSNLYRSLMHTSGYNNWHTDIYDRWTPENTNTDIPRLVDNDPNDNQRDSDRPGWLQNGTYLRITEIQLGYTFPEKWIGEVFKKTRVYLSAQNLYTFQAYKGYNPDYNTSDTFSQGFDFGSYPKPRVLMIGAELTF